MSKETWREDIDHDFGGVESNVMELKRVNLHMNEDKKLEQEHNDADTMQVHFMR